MAVGISELTVGYSRNGAVDYVEELNTKAITKTKELLGDIDGIRSALEKGWVGEAERNFVSNLQKSVAEVQKTLDTLKTTLDSQFGQIEENMEQMDKTIVPLN